MDITDVRVKIVGTDTDRLKAYCSITLDGTFVVRDLKIVDGARGLFLAMPSRKRTAPCPRCRHKNHLRGKFCSECGATLEPVHVPRDTNGRPQLHRDIAHPITAEFRRLVQERVVGAYLAEREAMTEAGDRPEPVGANGLDDDAAEFEDYDALIADLDAPRSGGPAAERRGAAVHDEDVPARASAGPADGREERERVHGEPGPVDSGGRRGRRSGRPRRRSRHRSDAADRPGSHAGVRADSDTGVRIGADAPVPAGSGGPAQGGSRGATPVDDGGGGAFGEGIETTEPAETGRGAKTAGASVSGGGSVDRRRIDTAASRPADAADAVELSEADRSPGAGAPSPHDTAEFGAGIV